MFGLGRNKNLKRPKIIDHCCVFKHACRAIYYILYGKKEEIYRRLADFRLADFRLADFRLADFRLADFRLADFRLADFRLADFRLADFRLV